MSTLDLSQVAGLRLTDPVAPRRPVRVPGAMPAPGPPAAPPPGPAPAPPPAPRDASAAPASSVSPPAAPPSRAAVPDLAPPEPRPGSADAPPGPAMPGVLIVDDNVRLARTVAAFMQMQGFRAHPAHSAEEALLAVQQARFDLILLDINMPGIDGLEVCGRLLATAPGARVLMVTGRNSAEDPLRAAAAGAQGLLTKPISLAALRDEMLRVLAA